MIHELLSILVPFGKLVVAASLLLMFYWLILKDKSSYNDSRLYLSSIAFLSILLSQFKVVVFTPPTRIVEVEALNASVSIGSGSINRMPVPQDSFLDLMTLPNILIALYAVVTLIFFISMLRQYVQIFRLKKNGSVEIKNGYSLVVNSAVPTPFSFGRNIFIGPELTGYKREMIVNHESWHIKHHHFVDVLLMEILVRLFWFNPIVWMVRKELRSVHEFQTDRSVLQEGYDLFHYQTIILEEVMGNHSCLANGFNQSFTKKRFIMMKNTNPFRFSALRNVALIPFLVAVFCLLSFTKGQGQVTYVQKKSTASQVDSLKTSLIVVSKKTKTDIPKPNSAQITINGSIYNQNTQVGVSEEKINKDLSDCFNKLSAACMSLTDLCAFTDFSQKGKEIGALTEHLEIGLNNTKITEKTFSPEFLSSIKQSDIQEAIGHFTVLKVTVYQIYKSQIPASEKASQFSDLISGLLQDKFISKIMEQALMGQSTIKPSNSSVTKDLPEFSLLIIKSSTGEISLSNFKGNHFNTLKYSGVARQVIDDCGMVSPNDERVSKFRFEIIKTKEGLTLKGIKGTAWTELSFSGPDGMCKQVINQFGMVN